jgi:hypothetical protein
VVMEVVVKSQTVDVAEREWWRSDQALLTLDAATWLSQRDYEKVRTLPCLLLNVSRLIVTSKSHIETTDRRNGIDASRQY